MAQALFFDTKYFNILKTELFLGIFLCKGYDFK